MYTWAYFYVSEWGRDKTCSPFIIIRIRCDNGTGLSSSLVTVIRAVLRLLPFATGVLVAVAVGAKVFFGPRTFAPRVDRIHPAQGEKKEGHLHCDKVHVLFFLYFMLRPPFRTAVSGKGEVFTLPARLSRIPTVCRLVR